MIGACSPQSRSAAPPPTEPRRGRSASTRAGDATAANAFPRIWHETFSRHVDPAWTAAEVDFLTHALPRGRVLDVACGFGRHALGLQALGYAVVGVDRDPVVAAAARAAGVDVLELDVRDLDRIEARFDGVISMWASFGWFDDSGNEAVLAAMARRLRPGGRLVLDLWNPGAQTAGERTLRGGVRERKRIADRRMRTELSYPGGETDVHDCRLYRPDELASLAARHGLEPLVLCTWYDESRLPTSEDARYQLVLG